MESGNFRPPPPQNRHPSTDHQTIVISDYVGDPYGCAKLGAHRFTGGGASRKIKKRACYQNYCIDSNQILHSDKDHQMSFVGGRNSRNHISETAEAKVV